jgi:hypothetical protein
MTLIVGKQVCNQYVKHQYVHYIPAPGEFTIDLFKCLKTIVSTGNLVDSPTWRVGESLFDY